MENATKALLIAAAVLIVIVLIALGVALVNSGSEGTGQAKSVGESTAVQAFNGQFMSYMGKNQSAAKVEALVSAIKASNNHNSKKVEIKDSKGYYWVKWDDKKETTSIEGNYDVLKGKLYDLEILEENNDGLISVIMITEK